MNCSEVDIVDHEMVLVSHDHYYPVGTTTQLHFLPQQQQKQQGASEKAPRRRRSKKKSGGGDGEAMMRNKRKLSESQLNMLELSFGSDKKLDTERKERLAGELGLDPRQVAVWFQNRRARWRSKTMEAEYTRLRSDHDNTLVQKCCLETQILELKDQLSEAEKKIQELSDNSKLGLASMNSPSSANDQEPLFYQENLFYSPENYNYARDLEWDDSIYYVW